MILEIKNLKKYFDIGRGKKVHAVDDISLNINEKEIVGLVGESGSGKTTLGRTVVGLWDKSAGEIRYKGEKLPKNYSARDFKKYAKEMQLIFQDPYSSLNPRMTVKEIVAEGLRTIGGFSSAQMNDKVAEWLRKVGLEPDHMSRYPHEFSGGQRQRIGIARAMIVEPKFVVCDEPISALDVSVQAQVINLLEDLKKSMGLTLLFIAHDLSMVRYVSDRMAVMYLGAMVELGPASEVYFRPKHPYTELLIKANPEPDPRLEKTRQHSLIKGEIPSPINVKAGCRFAGRCPKVMPHCATETPKWKSVGKEHFVACHLY
ncbi:MAG: oligopeptide/dipeptide ABC transporter ATP-binding protein [Pseudomonadota bacterium]|nr:oligopeptide/dipeptide ABC transporter ATP-binding protein [Pseudomonadota bacterium]